MPEIKVLYVRLPADLHRRLRLASVNEERPMSRIVIDAVRQYLDDTEVNDG